MPGKMNSHEREVDYVGGNRIQKFRGSLSLELLPPTQKGTVVHGMRFAGFGLLEKRRRALRQSREVEATTLSRITQKLPNRCNCLSLLNKYFNQ